MLSRHVQARSVCPRKDEHLFIIKEKLHMQKQQSYKITLIKGLRWKQTGLWKH